MAHNHDIPRPTSTVSYLHTVAHLYAHLYTSTHLESSLTTPLTHLMHTSCTPQDDIRKSVMEDTNWGDKLPKIDCGGKEMFSLAVKVWPNYNSIAGTSRREEESGGEGRERGAYAVCCVCCVLCVLCAVCVCTMCAVSFPS